MSLTSPDNSKIIEFFFNVLPSVTFETKVHIENLVSKNFFKNNCPHKTISSLLEIIALPFFKLGSNVELVKSLFEEILPKSSLSSHINFSTAISETFLNCTAWST